METRMKGCGWRHAARAGAWHVRLAWALLLGLALMLALAATAQAYVPGTPVWLRTVGSYVQPAITWNAATGPAGTVVTTGEIWNKTKANWDILTVKYDTNGHRLFTQALNGRQNLADWGNAVACDRLGDIFSVGTIGVSSANPEDVVVLKYSPKGKLLWARTYDGPGHYVESGARVALDALGNVYVAANSYLTSGSSAQSGIVLMKFDATGHRKWLVRFDPVRGAGTTRWCGDLVLAGGDLYLTGGYYENGPGGWELATTYKVDTNGHVKWGRTFAASAGRGAEGDAITVRGDRVAVGGWVWSRPSGPSDMLVVAYDLAGHQKYAFTYHSKVNQTDWVNDLTLDSHLNVYLTGVASVKVGASYERGCMTMKVDPRGRLVWGRSLGWGDGYVMVQDISGSVYIGGWLEGSANNDWLVAKYSPSGVKQWLHTWNAPGDQDDNAEGLVLSGLHTLFATGEVYGNDLAHGSFQEAALIRYDR